MKNGINVLSCFDGMACGLVALKRQRIKINKYYAFEIDKYAIKIAKKNHPEIIELGDINNWEDFKDIDVPDLILAGSPCQGFSIAGKRLNFEDPRSRLFFVFSDLLNYWRKQNPRLKFLLENVRMKKESSEIISQYMMVDPIVINSALVSAQNRVRYYWTNIEGVYQPKDKGLILRDIIEDDGNVDRLKSYCIDANYWKGGNEKSYKKGRRQLVFVGGIGEKDWANNGKKLSRNFSQGSRIYSDEGKAASLTAKGVGGYGGMTGVYQIKGAALRNQVTKRGTEPQLNIRKDDKSNCVVPSYAHKLNGVVRIGTAADINGHDYNKRIYSQDGKSPTLLANSGGNLEPKIATSDVYYRKLTPIECERLQTLDDNYSKGVSNTQRYKMIGNGWTVDVIAHILSFLPEEFYTV